MDTLLTALVALVILSGLFGLLMAVGDYNTSQIRIRDNDD